jgi:hypothetical protein
MLSFLLRSPASRRALAAPALRRLPYAGLDQALVPYLPSRLDLMQRSIKSKLVSEKAAAKRKYRR